LGYRLGVSYSRSDLAFVDRPDAAETSTTESDILSEVLTFDGQGDLAWLDGRAQTVAGVEYDIRKADVDSFFSDPVFGDSPSVFDESIDNVAGYVLQQFYLDERRFILTGGV